MGSTRGRCFDHTTTHTDTSHTEPTTMNTRSITVLLVLAASLSLGCDSKTETKEATEETKAAEPMTQDEQASRAFAETFLSLRQSAADRYFGFSPDAVVTLPSAISLTLIISFLE